MNLLDSPQDIRILQGPGTRLTEANVMFSTAGYANRVEYLIIWQEIMAELMN